MKTTKTTTDVADMLFAEMERVQKGEVRKDAIAGLTKLTDGLVKLARLEMDFAFRNWGEQPPSLPWIASKPLCQKPADDPTATPDAVAEVVRLVKAEATPTARTSQGQQIERQIKTEQAKLEDPKITPTMRKILTDKIALLQNRLERAEAEAEADGGGE